MNILHVIPGLTRERGGPSAVVEALTRHQAAAGHAVAVLTTDQGQRHGEHPTELAAGVRLERVAVRGPDRLAFAPGFAAAARSLLRSCDVVHVHSIFTHPVHAALREAAAAGVPVVLRPCGQLHPYSLARSRPCKRAYLTLWGRWVLRCVAAWHYTSEQEAAESWPGNGTPHFVLSNGIEPEELVLDRREARLVVARAWPELGDGPYVLFLGRLHPKKRIDLLLETFLAAAPPGWKLAVAGPDEAGLWAPLSHRILTGAAAARVVRVDTVSGRLKVALLAGAGLFALPSEHENFGIAALEALAAGTPALLSPHVDLAEPAQAAGVAFTAPVDADAWRARLKELLAQPGKLAKLADPARAWVAEHYAWKRLSAELLEQYRQARSRVLGLGGHATQALPPRASLRGPGGCRESWSAA